MSFSFLILADHYRDSVQLLSIQSAISSSHPDILQAAVMMATPSNVSILADAGIVIPTHWEGQPVNANALVIAVKAKTKSVSDAAVEDAKREIQKPVTSPSPSSAVDSAPLTTVREAVKSISPHPNLGLVSVPGPYAAAESLKLLRNGCHVFLFSNNVSMKEEILLKSYAREKNLLVMGPDCGTAILDGIPLGFANVVRGGAIGLVGASGTGLQAVSSYIHQMGEGCSQVIGVGGRDLSKEIGGETMLRGIQWLIDDPSTAVIGLVSKAPSQQVADIVRRVLQTSPKPVVVNFLGAAGDGEVNKAGQPIVAAVTLEDAARMAVGLLKKKKTLKEVNVPDIPASSSSSLFPPSSSGISSGQHALRGLFSGGTLCKESQLILKALSHSTPSRNFDFTAVDLGEDEYTLGRAHPMIDFTVRCEWISKEIEAAVLRARPAGGGSRTAILLDVVLGYGAHMDPSTALKPALESARKTLREEGLTHMVTFVGALCGTSEDPQCVQQQAAALESLGVKLEKTNAKATVVAAEWVIGRKLTYSNSAEVGYEEVVSCAKGFLSSALSSNHNSSSVSLLSNPSVLNLGLRHFVDPLVAMGVPVVHLQWMPPAGGDQITGLLNAVIDGRHTESSHVTTSPRREDGKEEAKAIRHKLDDYAKKIAAANAHAVKGVIDASPSLVGFALAGEVVSAFRGRNGAGRRLLTHAGPPVKGGYDGMCGPMQGAVLGAVLNEGWASSLAEAKTLARDSSRIEYSPCNEHSMVGPMCGVVGPSMPVGIVENTTAKITAYAPLNEGLGKVLRFGANDEGVLKRLRFMKEILYPALQKALQKKGPIDLKSVLSQGITMGDEGHNRVAACTLIFGNILGSTLARVCPQGDLADVMEFLSSNPHFFLNLSMAACKSSLEASANVEWSTMATVMARNGVDFGLRVSGTGKHWHVSPALPVKGLYFAGYGEKDANPDLGDSSITETAGIGGFAMAASPNIVKFVGGTLQDAYAQTDRMGRITLATNNNFPIPSINGRGTPTGTDVRAVIDTGILPVINTGIAHKKAGIGQIGAGITTAPSAVFVSAIKVFAELHGVRYYHGNSLKMYRDLGRPSTAATMQYPSWSRTVGLAMKSTSSLVRKLH